MKQKLPGGYRRILGLLLVLLMIAGALPGNSIWVDGAETVFSDTYEDSAGIDEQVTGADNADVNEHRSKAAVEWEIKITDFDMINSDGDTVTTLNHHEDMKVRMYWEIESGGQTITEGDTFGFDFLKTEYMGFYYTDSEPTALIVNDIETGYWWLENGQVKGVFTEALGDEGSITGVLVTSQTIRPEYPYQSEDDEKEISIGGIGKNYKFIPPSLAALNEPSATVDGPDMAPGWEIVITDFDIKKANGTMANASSNPLDHYEDAQVTIYWNIEFHGQTINKDDIFEFDFLKTEYLGFYYANSEPVSLSINNQIVGEWWIEGSKVKVKFSVSLSDDSVTGEGASGFFVTGQSIRPNYPYGAPTATKTLTIGNHSKTYMFRCPVLEPINETFIKFANEASNYSIEWKLTSGGDLIRDLSDSGTVTTHNNVLIEDHIQEGTVEEIRVYGAVTLPLSESDKTPSTSSIVDLYIGGSSRFELYNKTHEDMTYAQYKSYIQGKALRYGTFTHANGTQTVLVNLGTVPGNGLRYQEFIGSASIGQFIQDQQSQLGGQFSNALKNNIEAVYGNNNGYNGAIMFYHVTITVAYPRVIEDAVKANTATYNYNSKAVERTNYGTLTGMIGSGAIGPPGSITLFKTDGETGVLLKGAKFRLQKKNASGVFEYYDGTVYQTDENGRIRIEDLLAGTYRMYEIEAPEYYEIDGEGFTESVAIVENAQEGMLLVATNIRNYQGPDLVVGKSVRNVTRAGKNAGPGDRIEYTITVKNMTNSPINNVRISDPLLSDMQNKVFVNPWWPADIPDLQFITVNNGGVINEWVGIWTLREDKDQDDPPEPLYVDIAGGATVKITIIMEILALEDLDLNYIESIGGIIENIATVTTADEQFTATATIPIEVFTSSKSVKNNNGSGQVKAGERLTYTITAANVGNVGLPDVFVQDQLTDIAAYFDDPDAEVVEIRYYDANRNHTLSTYKTVADLRAGFSLVVKNENYSKIEVVFSVTVADDADLDSVSSLKNTATVNDTNPEASIPTVSEVETTKTAAKYSGHITDADEKAAYEADPVIRPGDVIEYKFTIKNVTDKLLAVFLYDNFSDAWQYFEGMYAGTNALNPSGIQMDRYHSNGTFNYTHYWGYLPALWDETEIRTELAAGETVVFSLRIKTTTTVGPGAFDIDKLNANGGVIKNTAKFNVLDAARVNIWGDPAAYRKAYYEDSVEYPIYAEIAAGLAVENWDFLFRKLSMDSGSATDWQAPGVTVLEDAEFELYQYLGNGQPGESHTDLSKPADWGYIDSYISDHNGLVTIDDLEEEVFYVLTETKAPDGYLLPTCFWTIYYDGTDLTVTPFGGEEQTAKMLNIEGAKTDSEASHWLLEAPAIKLPLSGSGGPWIHMYTGIMLMGLAVFAFMLLQIRKEERGRAGRKGEGR